MFVIFGIFLVALVIIAFMWNAWLAAFGLLAIGMIEVIGCAILNVREERHQERLTASVAIKDVDRFVDWMEMPGYRAPVTFTYNALRSQVKEKAHLNYSLPLSTSLSR